MTSIKYLKYLKPFSIILSSGRKDFTTVEVKPNDSILYNSLVMEDTENINYNKPIWDTYVSNNLFTEIDILETIITPPLIRSWDQYAGSRDLGILWSPGGLAFDNTGILHIANTEGGPSGTIQLSSNGTYTARNFSFVHADYPGFYYQNWGNEDTWGMGILPSGTEFVSANWGGTTWRVEPNTTSWKPLYDYTYGGVYRDCVLSSTNTIYVAAGNILKIDPAYIDTYWASTTPEYTNITTPIYTSTSMVRGLALDYNKSDNILYFIDGNAIMKLVSGVTTLIAGSLTDPVDFINGNGAAARFNTPQGLTLDPSGNIYVADYNNRAIRKITPTGDVTTWLESDPLAPFGFRPIKVCWYNGTLYFSNDYNANGEIDIVINP